MEKYWNHLSSCNKMKEPLNLSGFLNKPYDEALEKRIEKAQKERNTCTCGMEQCLKETKEAMFTPAQIAKVQELSYEAGFVAGSDK